MLVLEQFHSQPSFHGKKCVSCLTLGLDSLPDYPFMLTPLWQVMCLSGDKGDSVFKQIVSQTVSGTN